MNLLIITTRKTSSKQPDGFHSHDMVSITHWSVTVLEMSMIKSPASKFNNRSIPRTLINSNLNIHPKNINSIRIIALGLTNNKLIRLCISDGLKNLCFRIFYVLCVQCILSSCILHLLASYHIGVYSTWTFVYMRIRESQCEAVSLKIFFETWHKRQALQKHIRRFSDTHIMIKVFRFIIVWCFWFYR